MTIGWRSTEAPAVAVAGCRSRMTSPSTSVIRTLASVVASTHRQHRRDMAVADDEATKLGRLHQPVPTPSPSDFAGASQELVRIERLGHVQVSAGRQPLLAVVRLALRGEQYDVRVGQAHLVLDRPAHLEPVAPGAS